MSEINKDLLLKRFNEKWEPVTESGCWIWIGCPKSNKKNRYAQIVLNGKTLSAHRVAYLLFIGPIPTGKMVLHSCDNYLCVNPFHLRIGDQKDNMKDMYMRNRRNPTGENGGNHILKERQVLEILYDRRTVLEISKDYPEVSHFVIRDIKNGRTWRHLTGGKKSPYLPDGRRGEGNSSSKLNEKQVLDIYNDKRPVSEIAKDYPVIKPGTIRDIRSGRLWKHVTTSSSVHQGEKS